MGSRGQLEEWAGRVLRERIAIGAVFVECRNRRCHPARARDLAEDAVQQALVQAARITDLAERFGGFAHFCNWVRRVAINHVRSAFRRREPLALDDWEAIMGPAGEPLAITAEVRALLNELSEADRHLLMLHYEDELTLDQVAERLLPPDDRSENARRLDIWRRRREILRWLRAQLSEDRLYPGG